MRPYDPGHSNQKATEYIEKVPYDKNTYKDYLEKRSGDRNVDSGWASGTTERRQRWQHKTELDGDNLSMAYVPLTVIRHKRSPITCKLSICIL